MATALFKDTTYAVSALMTEIRRGDIALPDIQRPFVWNATKVRDLFDSMYQGFPVGFLLFWETGADVGTRQIGTGDAPPRLLIVDGQQRLTALFAVMTGTPVLTENYVRERIRIAFRPSDATFAVTDAAIERNPEYIPDISELWAPSARRQTVRQFLERLEERRGGLDQAEHDRLDDSIDRLYDLHNYTFKVVMLDSDVDEERVAEIFVRINSEGVPLNQADFILTLMSVFWEKGRRELEEFARHSKTPALSGASPFNWYIRPQPPHLLRVSVAMAFRRARLQNVYPLLRGKDMDSGKFNSEKRQEQFDLLAKAQAHVLNLTNWHEFLHCLERAGFRGAKMISSDNAILYSYVMWLIGRVDYGVPIDRLRELIARWFFMAHTTARYSGSFETQVERDLRLLSEQEDANTEDFCRAVDGIIDRTLTADYWSITLPNALNSSAPKSPSLLAYIAALNILDATPLLSRGRVRSWLDPAVTSKKGIERHHLFPRQYLRTKLKLTDSARINQIANMAPVEWSDNIAISDKDPQDYWPAELARKRLSDEELEQQCRWHALPDGWESMPYPTFLEQRRILMARVAQEAFELLSQSTYRPTYPATTQELPPAKKTTGRRVSLSDLLDAGMLTEGTTLVGSGDTTAVLREDGQIEVDGEIADSPSRAATLAEGGGSHNGWRYWSADTKNGLRSLESLRDNWLTDNGADS